MLGCSTDSYDSEGKRVRETPFSGITSEKIEAVLSQYRGEIEQVPPMFVLASCHTKFAPTDSGAFVRIPSFSALKMDGKPLYEYARSGTPLPRPIAARKVTVHELSLLRFTPGEGHTYEYPKEVLQGKEKEELERLARMVKEGGTVVPEVETLAEAEDKEVLTVADGSSRSLLTKTNLGSSLRPPLARPPIFELSMTVSSGTYVRSIIHDIGIALGSSAHVVKLTRTRQGEFTLNPEAALPAAPSVPVVDRPSVETERTDTLPLVETATAPAPLVLETFAGGCVEWEVLESALADLQTVKEGGEAPARDEDGLLPWEVELLHRCKEV